MLHTNTISYPKFVQMEMHSLSVDSVQYFIAEDVDSNYIINQASCI